MKTIIAGSKSIQSYDLVAETIQLSAFTVTEVFSGMRSGPDIFGYRWGVNAKIPVRCFKPDWEKLGKPAELIKCFEMAAYADALIIITDGTDHVAEYQHRIARSCTLKVYSRVVERPKTTIVDLGRVLSSPTDAETPPTSPLVTVASPSVAPAYPPSQLSGTLTNPPATPTVRLTARSIVPSAFLIDASRFPKGTSPQSPAVVVRSPSDQSPVSPAPSDRPPLGG